jgi:hypothetical protein
MVTVGGTAAEVKISFDGNQAYEYLYKYVEDNLFQLFDDHKGIINDVAWMRGKDPNLCLALFDWKYLDHLRMNIYDRGLGEFIQNMSFFGESLVWCRLDKSYRLGTQVGEIKDKGTLRFIIGVRMYPDSLPKIFFDVMSMSHLSTGYTEKV